MYRMVLLASLVIVVTCIALPGGPRVREVSRDQIDAIVGGCYWVALKECPLGQEGSCISGGPCVLNESGEFVCPLMQVVKQLGPYHWTKSAPCGLYDEASLAAVNCARVYDCRAAGCLLVAGGAVCQNNIAQEIFPTIPKAPAGDPCPAESGCDPNVAMQLRAYKLLASCSGLVYN
jgi:hypothetical protein